MKNHPKYACNILLHYCNIPVTFCSILVTFLSYFFFLPFLLTPCLAAAAATGFAIGFGSFFTGSQPLSLSDSFSTNPLLLMYNTMIGNNLNSPRFVVFDISISGNKYPINGSPKNTTAIPNNAYRDSRLKRRRNIISAISNIKNNRIKCPYTSVPWSPKTRTSITFFIRSKKSDILPRFGLISLVA